MTGYKITNLKKLMDVIGEDEVKQILSDFSCPLNADVESFLRFKALPFAEQGWAQTHLVFASYRDKPVLVGYFTLANKYISVPYRTVKGELRRRLSKHSTPNDNLKAYLMAIPLIAQLGKNYANEYNKLITGDELLGMACEKIKGIQYDLGGRFAYLECEDKEKLVSFYNRFGFVEFDRRPIDTDEDGLSGKCLIQMIRSFKGKEYST